MQARIDLRFRPGMVIFVGESGAGICEQFQHIIRLTGLDDVLCQGLALLHVDENSDRAVSVPIQKDPFARPAVVEDDLSQLIERLLREVQANSNLEAIRKSGYPVSNSRTQIYIAGEANQPWLGHVLETVRGRLRKIDQNLPVCFMLTSSRMKQKTGSLQKQTSYVEPEELDAPHTHALYWSNRILANFCYLYEDVIADPQPAYVSETETYYAIAEALLALLTTGMTTEPFFEDLLQLNNASISYENVGTLSTSMIIFPREAILQYCGNRLSDQLIQQWLQEFREISLNKAETKKAESDANRATEKIALSIRDQVPRPYADSSSLSKKLARKISVPMCPTLAVLRHGEGNTPPTKNALEEREQRTLLTEQVTSLGKLTRANERLFKPLASDVIETRYKQRKLHFQSWTEMVEDQASQAVSAYGEWDSAVSRAWGVVRTRFSTQINQFVDHLWSGNEKGFHQAAIFIDKFDENLADLATQQSEWRNDHENAYRIFLDEFDQLSRGDWATSQNPGGIQGGGQGRPTMHGTSSHTQTSTQNTIIGGDSAPATAAPQLLPPREEAIAQRLRQRVDWLQMQVPPLPTQIAVAFPFIFSLVLTAMIWMPADALPYELVTVGTSLLVSLLVGSAHWLFRSWHQKKVEKAKEELLTFYRRYYAHRCEMREDRLRITVMGPLRRQVQSIRDRLDNLVDFLQQLQQSAQQQMCSAQEELFNSPAGVRDILIANGERLQRNYRNTLEDIAQQIDRARVREPVEEWHQTMASMKKALIERFRHQSFLEMNDTAAQQEINSFTRNISEAYCTGPLADIQRALHNHEIWGTAFDQAGDPLYQAQMGLRKAEYTFVCGREMDISIGQQQQFLPNYAYPVHTSDTHEWVLVAALFRGEAPATFRPDLLFPYITDATSSPRPQSSPLPVDDQTFQQADEPFNNSSDSSWQPPDFSANVGYQVSNKDNPFFDIPLPQADDQTFQQTDKSFNNFYEQTTIWDGKQSSDISGEEDPFFGSPSPQAEPVQHQDRKEQILQSAKNRAPSVLGYFRSLLHQIHAGEISDEEVLAKSLDQKLQQLKYESPADPSYNLHVYDAIIDQFGLRAFQQRHNLAVDRWDAQLQAHLDGLSQANSELARMIQGERMEV